MSYCIHDRIQKENQVIFSFSTFCARQCILFYLRDTLFKTVDKIGAETLSLHFIATEIGHKNVQILLKLAETLA